MDDSNLICINVSGVKSAWRPELIRLAGQEPILRRLCQESKLSSECESMDFESLLSAAGINDEEQVGLASAERWIQISWENGLVVCSSFNRLKVKGANNRAPYLRVSAIFPIPDEFDFGTLSSELRGLEALALKNLAAGESHVDEGSVEIVSRNLQKAGSWSNMSRNTINESKVGLDETITARLDLEKSPTSGLLPLIRHYANGAIRFFSLSHNPEDDYKSFDLISAELLQSIPDRAQSVNHATGADGEGLKSPSNDEGPFKPRASSLFLAIASVLFISGVCFFFVQKDAGCADPKACNFNTEQIECLYPDSCGICGGPGPVFECGCTEIPNGACDCAGTLPAMHRDCAGKCLNDEDADDVCDEDEVLGCTDRKALNFNAMATESDNSCQYLKQRQEKLEVNEEKPKAPSKPKSRPQLSLAQRQAQLFCERLNGEVQGFYIKPKRDEMRPMLIKELLKIQQFEDEGAFDEAYDSFTHTYKAWSSKELMLSHLCLFTSLSTAQRQEFVQILGDECIGYEGVAWIEIKKSFENYDAIKAGRFNVPDWCDCKTLNKP